MLLQNRMVIYPQYFSRLLSAAVWKRSGEFSQEPHQQVDSRKSVIRGRVNEQSHERLLFAFLYHNVQLGVKVSHVSKVHWSSLLSSGVTSSWFFAIPQLTFFRL